MLQFGFLMYPPTSCIVYFLSEFLSILLNAIVADLEISKIDGTSSAHLSNTQRDKKNSSSNNEIRRYITDHCYRVVRGLEAAFSCTFLRRHFIELSLRHLQETTTVSGIPEPPPHPLSVLIRPLHVYNTPALPPPWHYTYSYGCAWQTLFIIYCKRGNI